LRAYGIHNDALLAVHEHNEAQAAEQVIARLQRGERVAYVSDAGTPAVSDPGARLVALVRAAGLRVIPLSGASSVTTILSAAGITHKLHDTGFQFLGFLPSKTQEREAAILKLQTTAQAVVLFEAPHRIEALAKSLGILGDRQITIGRELTKQFEEIATVACNEFSQWLAADSQRLRGEFALVLHPYEAPTQNNDAERILRLLLAELPLKTAVKLAAEISKAPRNDLYDLALALKNAKSD